MDTHTHTHHDTHASSLSSPRAPSVDAWPATCTQTLLHGRAETLLGIFNRLVRVAFPALVKAFPDKELDLFSIKLLTTKKVAQTDINFLNNAQVRGVGEAFYMDDKGNPLELELEVEQDVKRLVPDEFHDRLPRQ